ncbi:hypothetical protein ACFQE5_04745 [Pseudonocardia hispaniensis]|uniref:Uncharacterized protein n=1 Tax=Pseudonocardia hispaniensis TaxID=904933 RepID=A0ABW1IYF8_9PSEU
MTTTDPAGPTLDELLAEIHRCIGRRQTLGDAQPDTAWAATYECEAAAWQTIADRHWPQTGSAVAQELLALAALRACYHAEYRAASWREIAARRASPAEGR